jgi:hypothetical protein
MFSPLKMFLVVVLVFVLLVNLAYTEEDDCLEATLQGRSDAQIYHTSFGWFLLGVPAVLGGPLGMIGIPVLAYLSKPTPETFPDEATNIDCYLEGYRDAANDKNGRAALRGVAVGGVGVMVGVIVAFIWYFF